MTEVKIVSKRSTFLVGKVYIAKDETIESLMYWVHIVMAPYSGVFAQFQYEGSTYVVSIDE